MQAHEEAFSFIKKECYYEVPFFQRNYVWTYENWEELLNSLMDTDKCSFLGSLILKQIPTKSGQVGRFSIIDGQQRLTTLSILMRACYDTLNEYKGVYPAKAIEELTNALRLQLFVVADTFSGTSEVKIKHSHIDKPYFESIINGEYSTQEKLNQIIIKEEVSEKDNLFESKSNRILLCYKYFRVQLSKHERKEIEALWLTLTKDEIKFLVNIDLLPNENEQAIFDAVNSSGVRLTSSDTIKNALFQKYIEILKIKETAEKAEQNAISLYNEYWKKAFLSDVEDAQYWGTQHQSGRLFRDNIEILLHCIAVIEGFFDPQENKMADLAICYKKFISKMSADELKSFIVRIKDYADLYKEKIVLNEISVLYSYDDYFLRLIHILDTLEISTFHPYLLSLLYKNKKSPNDKEFRDKCAELERYIILHAVCRATTKNYNKECIQLINGESLNEMLKNCEDITEERFLTGLQNMDGNKLATLILFWVELYLRSTQNVDIKELKYTFTLEHIMPQKWREHWSVTTNPVFDEDGLEIKDIEKAENQRAIAVYKIGNMTLLNSKLNTSLRNYSFKRKIDGEGRKRGMKALGDCLLTKEVTSLSAWNEGTISERTHRIIEYIKNIWDIVF